MSPEHTPLHSMSQRRAFSPAQLLAISFGGLIAAGTLLLSLPIAAESGERLALVDAFFTATSAVCVTGLIVVDTPRALSAFGEMTLLGLIQLGGLGHMTLSSALALLFGRRLSLRERQAVEAGLNVGTLEGISRFTWTVLRFTLAIEAIGATILLLWWWPTHGLGQATYLAVFHSVSAFNNAGFSLFPDNLIRFRSDVVVNLTVAGLIIVGGVGFLVLSELARVRRWRPLSLHSKLALSLTGVLLAGGTLLVWTLESGNAATLGRLPYVDQFLAAFFHATSTRTAGFNTLDIPSLTPATLFLTTMLMFIGAAPGGTGGGVKVTTFGVIVLALWATIQGRDEPVAFSRRIPADVVTRALFICLIAFLAVNVTAGALLVLERGGLLETLFETTSAFGTVGLSLGLPGEIVSRSGSFTQIGKLLVTLLMFTGRVGPLTLALALAGRRPPHRNRPAAGRVLIG